MNKNIETKIVSKEVSKSFFERKFLKTKEVMRAVDKVNLWIKKRETLGLVGESGCGKTTLGRIIVGLIKPTEGKVFFDGYDLYNCSEMERKKIKTKIGAVFQNPFSSLDPRMTIIDIVAEPMDVNHLASGEERIQRVEDLLKKVGLNSSHLYRYPHEFSGGQRQRIAIARALSTNPEFLLFDEPTSSLDVFMQARILDLISKLQEELGLTYLFISHDLSVIRNISTRVAVMYLGKIVELAPNDEIFTFPAHPYTRCLLSAVPRIDPARKGTRIKLKGGVPELNQKFPGCRFSSRCPEKVDICKKVEPQFIEISPGHWVACHIIEKRRQV